MAFLQEKILLSVLLIFCMTVLVSSHSRYTPPTVAHLTDYFPHVTIDQGFSKFFGGSNIQLISNGSMANLALDKTSGEVHYNDALYIKLHFQNLL
jgi:xyloglucan:xyloglucosyl transferase